jgi:uncharacterized protein GlcG (DUF336 family)
MRTKYYLTADDVQKIANASRRFAQERSWNVTISIVDDAGFLLYLERLDGAGPYTAEIAAAKARTAALGRRASGEFEENIKQRPALATFPYVAMVRGGVPIVHEGQYVGGIGVSGRASDEDEQVANAGREALG